MLQYNFTTLLSSQGLKINNQQRLLTPVSDLSLHCCISVTSASPNSSNGDISTPLHYKHQYICRSESDISALFTIYIELIPLFLCPTVTLQFVDS